MNFMQFGKEKTEAILLLHGGGLSWWSCREAASLLEKKGYRVIMPILDGHAECDHPFTTIEDNAAEILSFIDERLGGRVLMICGLSLGGQILLEMLSQRRDVCQYALVESAAVLPQKATKALVGPAFGSSYALIKSRAFAKMQFKSLRLKPELFEEYYRDTCRITKQDFIAIMKANTSYTLKDEVAQTAAEVHVVVGDKETGVILQSAEEICRRIPGSTLHRLPDLYHGEFSINHADRYAAAVREIIEGTECAF